MIPRHRATFLAQGFSERFYFQQTGAHLAPVLDTLQYLRHETGCWFEITTLLIPGHNDSSAEIEAQTRWIADHLGPDVPLHFTAFHPDYKMMDVAPTRLPRSGARARSRSATACITSTRATCTTSKVARRLAPLSRRTDRTRLV